MNDKKLSATTITSKVKAGGLVSLALLAVVVAGLLFIPERIPDAIEDQLWTGVVLAAIVQLVSFGASYQTAEKADNFEETRRL